MDQAHHAHEDHESLSPDHHVSVVQVGEGDGNEAGPQDALMAPPDESSVPQGCMSLASLERVWAELIKDIVEEANSEDEEEVIPRVALSDMCYAQLALIDEGDLEASFERARSLQDFVSEYSLNNSLEEGLDMLRAFTAQQPGFCLSVQELNSQSHSYGFVYDQAAFDQARVRIEEDWRVVFGGLFYIQQLLTPDFQSIRQGCSLFVECEGMNWEKLSPTTLQRFCEHLVSFYPLRYREINFFHSNLVSNLAFSMSKRFLPEDITSRVQLAIQLPLNLGHWYKQPTSPSSTRDISRELFLEQAEPLLRKRYKNETRFSFSK